MGYTVADVVDALEGRDDLFVMGDDDDGGLELAGHVVEDADYSHGARWQPVAARHRRVARALRELGVAHQAP